MSPYVWLIMVVAFVVLEALTTQLVSIWLALGALLGLFASMLGLSPIVQIAVFVVSTLILLFATRPLVKKFVYAKKVPTNIIDSVIGKIGLVSITIDNDKGEGQIKLQGIEWTARSATGAIIAKGEKVSIDRIEGVKLFVSAVTEQ